MAKRKYKYKNIINILFKLRKKFHIVIIENNYIVKIIIRILHLYLSFIVSLMMFAFLFYVVGDARK